MSNQIVTIPFHGQTVQTVEVDGKPHVVFRPLVESLGMDFKSQHRRLSGKSWACMVKMTVQVGGQGREVTLIDLRTLTMWLATIDANRVAEHAEIAGWSGVRIDADEQRGIDQAGSRSLRGGGSVVGRASQGVQACSCWACECAGTIRGYGPYAGQGSRYKGSLRGIFGNVPKLCYRVAIQRNNALAVLPTPQSVTELVEGVQYV